jgi:hypothetical protein
MMDKRYRVKKRALKLSKNEELSDKAATQAVPGLS